MILTRFTLGLALLAALAAGCHRVPVTGRRALNIVDATEVANMSRAEFENMKTIYRISRNRTQIEQLRRVGENLSRVIPWWELGGAEWEWVVFDAPSEINAFAMSGGKVGVFSGLFRLVENDAQLAAVISHEIAHVTAKHVDERLSQMLAGETLGMVSQVAGAVAGSAAIYNIAGGSYLAAVGIGQSSPAFDRQKELEADEIGLIYMADAGYDPREAVTVLDKLDVLENGAQSNNMTPARGATHPTNPTRIARMLEAMPRALEIYEAKNGGLTDGPAVVAPANAPPGTIR
jgi:predicted Zn-dependent protease